MKDRVGIHRVNEMLVDVTAAKHLGNYELELEFEDGTRGVVDFSRYLDRGGVFEKFRDMRYFTNFRVDSELGVLSWEGGVDIAPETLYELAKRKVTA